MNNTEKNITNYIVNAIIAIVIVAGAFLIFKPQAPNVTVNTPANQYGAVSSLGQSPLAFNGISHFYQPIAFSQGTSTLCAWKTTATTTLSAFGVLITSSPASNVTYELGVGTFLGATTTPIIASYTVLSGAQAAFNATNTATFSSTYNDGILPPNTWVDFNANNTGGTNTAKGWCTFIGRGLTGSNT